LPGARSQHATGQLGCFRKRRLMIHDSPHSCDATIDNGPQLQLAMLCARGPSINVARFRSARQPNDFRAIHEVVTASGISLRAAAVR
jgi:hypothetical protein